MSLIKSFMNKKDELGLRNAIKFAFKERVANQNNNLNLKIYYFTNENEMKNKSDDRIYMKFAACFMKE